MNVVSLYDESGNMLRPWAFAGFHAWCFDILNEDRDEAVGAGWLHFRRADLFDPAAWQQVIELRPVFLASFPPCTELAALGAKHWARKRAANPWFQQDAMALVHVGAVLGETIGCPWFAENPRSAITTFWRKPDHNFNPCDYGGYLPTDDVHPRWPQYIAPRDAYPKWTGLWTGGGIYHAAQAPRSDGHGTHRL